MLVEDKNQDKNYHGTTTVGITCKDGTVLAADTRATAGFFVAHRNVRKIYKVDEHIGMTIAGGVADAQRVVNSLIYYSNIYKLERTTPMPVNSAAMLISNILFSARFYPLITIVLLGGFDYSGPSIYHIDLFGSLIKEKFVSSGSGSPVAYGILEDEYNENLTIKEAMPIATKAVIAAIRRNAGTGDDFNLTIINEKGYKEFSNKEKSELLNKMNWKI